jgi:hypothetical protein
MSRQTTLLRLAIFFDAPLFYPLQQSIRFIYATLFCWLLQAVLRKSAAKRISVFPRRSSTEKDSSKSFNFLFSDLDIGICVDDLKDIDAIKQRYYQLKSIFVFLGELEFYEFHEFLELQKLTQEIGNIYDMLRDLRKVGWIKGQLLTQERSLYHRYKDHRALRKIKKKWQLQSARISVLAAAKPIEKFIPWQIAEQSLELSSPFSIFCPYLFLRISLQPNSPRLKEWLFLLSCTPTMKRDDAALDSFCTEVRSQYPAINSLFEKLNRMEFLVATAFVRGAKNSESWHATWLNRLAYWNS